MKPILTLLLSLLCLTASASPGQPYFVRQLSNLPVNLCDARIGDGTPTNIVGYPAYTWWIAQCGLSTNAGLTEQYLSDVSGSSVTLTNSQADKGQWLFGRTNVLNGYDAFTADDTFTVGNARNAYSAAYTNSGNAEIVFVSMFTNVVDTQILYCMAKKTLSDSTSRMGWLINGKIEIFAGTRIASVVASSLLNKWVVYNFVYQGASSTVYTNNVQGAAGNPGANAGKGIILFCDSQADATPFTGKTAEIISYRTNLSAAARTTLFQYLTNKYNISP